MNLKTLALATALASNAYAQDTKQEAKLDFNARAAFNDQGRLDTQNTVTLTRTTDGKKDLVLKFLGENIDDHTLQTGFDLRTQDVRLNLGYLDGPNNFGRASFTYYPDHNGLGHDVPNFIGATYMDLPLDDKATVFGGFNLGESLRLEASADTDGTVRAVLFPKIDKGVLAIGVGKSDQDDLYASFVYNTDKFRTTIIAGKNRPLDARIGIGKINPKFAYAHASVTETGINEIGPYQDPFFKFGIGSDPRFEFREELSNLAEEAGSFAVFARYVEDSKIWINGAYRIGDVGPCKNVFVAPGVYRNLASGYNGFTVEGGFYLFDNRNAGVRIKWDVGEQDAQLGAFLEIKF